MKTCEVWLEIETDYSYFKGVKYQKFHIVSIGSSYR